MPTRYPSQEQITEAVLAFINARTWTDHKQIIEARHDMLLTDAAEQLMAALLDHYRGDEEATAVLQAHWVVLARCHRQGIDAAFADRLPAGEIPDIPPHLIPQLQAMHSEEELSTLRDEHPELLPVPQHMATQAQTSQGSSMSHPLPDELPTLLQELQNPLRLSDMPHRIQVCQAALALVDRTQQPELWAALQSEFGNSLAQNPWGTRADNLEAAIAHYQQALEVCTRQAFPAEWAAVQHNLANAYCVRIYGERADNLEVAIAHYQQALEVCTRQAFPAQWVMTQHNLATAYRDRIEGERADNLEAAIAHYQQALEVYTRQAFPVQWALTQHNLAIVYYNRIRGARADNLEAAIAHYQQALEVCTRQAFPAEWAAVQHNLATAYYDRIEGVRADNLEAAIVHYQQALEVYTRQAFPADWALTQHNLATAYRDRIRGARADNLEAAIAHFQQVLEVYTRQAFPADWAVVQHNLALAYYDRIEGVRADNLEAAIAHYQQALEVYARQAFPAQWALTQHNLATAYCDRIEGVRADNLEAAIVHYQQVLEVRTQQAVPVDWAATQNNLATAYVNRIRGERADNLEAAIVHYQQALEVYTRQAFPAQWALTQHNLATAYRDRIEGARVDNLEAAIVHYQQALEVRTRQAFPMDWAATQHNLAAAYHDRIEGARVDNLEAAIAHYQQALEVRTRQAFPMDWAATQNNLAAAYADRIRGERADNLEVAIAHYQQALDVYTLEQFPADCRRTLRNLGRLHFAEGHWEEACAAYLEAIAAGDTLLAAAYTEEGRQAEVGETAQLYARTAYCFLRLGQPAEALVRLEQGKTRLLAEALALGDADLTGLPDASRQAVLQARQDVRALEAEMCLPPETPARRSDRMLAAALRQARTELTHCIAAIRRDQPDFMPSGLDLLGLLGTIPVGGALVAPLFTSQGSAVFILPSGTETVTADHLLWLDHVTDSHVATLLQGPSNVSTLGGWLGAYLNRHTDPHGWFAAIEQTGQALWEMLLEPIQQRLATVGLAEGAPVLLMPQGGIGLLPLHAAWRKVEGTRRAFLDDYTVSYAPSGYALTVSQRRQREPHRRQRSLLAVINPTANLPFTPLEGEAVMALFDPATRHHLVEGEATMDAVVQGASGRSYVHFACHGFYAWLDVMQSGLLLADGNLTLTEILARLDLKAVRLVILSACETGLTDIRHPDEYLGLPAGFLQAGAQAVISTLWTVDDLSTMLLMEQFYQVHLHDHVPPAGALRQAQRWLRDLTAEHLRQRFAAEREALLTTRMSGKVVSAQYRRFATLDPDARPFAHPFYWAAFTFSGA
jgi:CHAT domain-containing protein